MTYYSTSRQSTLKHFNKSGKINIKCCIKAITKKITLLLRQIKLSLIILTSTATSAEKGYTRSIISYVKA